MSEMFDDDGGAFQDDGGSDAGVNDGGFDFEDLMVAGTAYALYRHGQDRQAAQIIGAMQRLNQKQQIDSEDLGINVEVQLRDDEATTAAPVSISDYADIKDSACWDQYVGQDPLKRQMLTYINSAQKRGRPLPHVLLASGYAGVGKTKMARLIAQTMGVKMVELMPPFNIYTLAEAASQLGDGDILFIDEIHKLAEHGKRGAEILLKVLDEGVAYLPDGTVEVLADITVIGATTDRDMLPETVIDRFKIKPYFQAYSRSELGLITLKFAQRHDCLDEVTDEAVVAISRACKGTPRLCEELVLACQAQADLLGRPPTWEELLDFLEVELDGMTRVDIQYVTSLYQFYRRQRKDGTVEYIAGEAAMQSLLRQTKNGIARIERFLMEQGLVDRTPQGRRLTAKGVEAAQDYIARGNGSTHVMTTPTPSVRHQRLTKLLLLLIESDVDAFGWGQPARMYAVTGTYDDPQAELVTTMTSHPIEVCQQMFDDGLRPKDEAIGIAVCVEGWRYVDVEFLQHNDPDTYAQVRGLTQQSMPYGASEEELQVRMRDAWSSMVSKLGPPSSLPDWLRVENRHFVTVFRDGSSGVVLRDRGGEPFVSSIGDAEMTVQARLPNALHTFLRGERPQW